MKSRMSVVPWKAEEVDDRRADADRLESIAVAGRPRRHESAVAPAHESEALGIGDAVGDHLSIPALMSSQSIPPQSLRFAARNFSP